MSYNGSGQFNINSAGQPVVATTLIEAAVFNAFTADIATGLSTAICKDGQTTISANIPFNSKKITGLGDGTSIQDAATLNNIINGTGVYVATVGGTADAITLTPSPAITAYTTGQTFKFLAGGSNTTNVTVNVSGLGAKAITKNGTTALVANDIPSGQMLTIIYDGTRFILSTSYLFPFTAKGDLITATAARTPVRLAVGSNGTIPMARSADTNGLAYVAALTSIIYGLTYANNGADATNDLDIASGGAMDATGAYFMAGSALTKQSDVAWAVGTNAGALDTGVVGNSDYYIWIIARSDTGVVDYLFSLSSTAPTMPASYDFKRLIGWFKRVGGTIVALNTYETDGGGLELLWEAPTLDVDLTNTLTTSERTDAVKVPLNFSTIAHINVYGQDGASGWQGWVYCPDVTSAAPSATAAPLANFGTDTGDRDNNQMRIRTSATGTIAARASIATVDAYRVSTMGFQWARRN